ncbi:MAG TPA: PCYCGC motif-containing (lipo)protein [Candidatus Limnocylindrales bacterium]|nr:PCYCGC motif-containing (lipo)protein [Candidatus Limnocylindrales bacterium]
MSRLTRGTPRKEPFGAWLIILGVLVAGSAAAACIHGQAPSDPHLTMAPADEARAAAWQARPAYTHTTAATEEAYQYALEHPLVLQWIPCFCGCGAMGHGNNLDCYFEQQAGGSVVFEEHASYCQVCVDITLRTKQMAASGASLATIRGAIDAEFGTVGPGTDTARPV